MTNNQEASLLCTQPGSPVEHGRSFKEPPACIAVLCPAPGSWCCPRGPPQPGGPCWPEEQGAGGAAGHQPSDSPREQGQKLGGHVGWGPGVVVGPCVFSLVGEWGGASPGSLCKAGSWLPLTRAVDVRGVMAGGWRWVQFSVLPLGIHIPP